MQTLSMEHMITRCNHIRSFRKWNLVHTNNTVHFALFNIITWIFAKQNVFIVVIGLWEELVGGKKNN